MPSRRPSRVLLGSRCSHCMMRPELCVCSEIPRLETKVRLVLMIHASELKSTTNTGRLAASAFETSRIIVRGLPNAQGQHLPIVDNDSEGLLLFPSEDSVELTEAFVRSIARPITLVVPDGTWRQASKVAKREPELAKLTRVRIPKGVPTQYHLRLAPTQESLCTLEAIARAIGVLESKACEQQLDHLFKLIVNRTLWSRGQLSLKHCFDYIPKEAIEHLRQRSIQGNVG